MIATLILTATVTAEVRQLERVRPLLEAMRQVETGGQPNGGRDALGDGGRSLGPYQIMRAYWQDSRVPGRYDQVRDRRYAERVIVAYWRRYCPRALAARDFETLARVHNGGGPAGARKAATLGYWKRIHAAMGR